MNARPGEHRPGAERGPAARLKAIRSPPGDQVASPSDQE